MSNNIAEEILRYNNINKINEIVTRFVSVCKNDRKYGGEGGFLFVV